MDIAWQFLEALAPLVVGLVTVPCMAALKRLLAVVDRWPAWAQQLVVLVIAFTLTQLGAALQVSMTTDIHLFTEADLSALLSAAVAYAVHAGQRASRAGR